MRWAARIRHVTKEYVLDGGTVRALQGVDLDVPAGDYVAVMGASGSGKSTLLNLLGCLDRPSSGSILLGEEDVTLADDDRLSEIRATHIGFVFQSYNLIPQLTVLENIEVPLIYQGNYGSKYRKRCRELAEMVGLGDRLGHRPTQLSGGQQQRVAIARSLVNDPLFILADEPTGNLDSATSDEILNLLESLNRAGKTIIMVTHEPDVGARTKRIVRLMDGMVQSDQRLEKSGAPKAERGKPKTESEEQAGDNP
jgi:putative ABC transport system ATP-binding protein